MNQHVRMRRLKIRMAGSFSLLSFNQPERMSCNESTLRFNSHPHLQFDGANQLELDADFRSINIRMLLCTPSPFFLSLSLSLSLFLSPFLCMSVCVCVCVYPWRRVSVCVCVYMCVNMPQYIYEASLIELGFSRFAAAVTSGATQKHSDQLLSFLAWSFVPDSDRNCVSTVPFRVRLCVCVFGFSTGRGEEGNFV